MSKMDQQFLNRNTEMRFAQLDYNNNGFIEWNDYLGEAQSVLQRFDVKEDSAKGQAVIRAYHEKWVDLVAAVDSDGDGRISLEEFKARMMDPDYCSAKADLLNRAIGDAIMDIADSDGDGRFSFDEFRKFPTPAKAGVEQAAEAFLLLDADGDGLVSKDEVHEMMKHYLSSSDQIVLDNQIFGNIAANV